MAETSEDNGPDTQGKRPDKPLVAICIPVLNGAKFIPAAVASVWDQTYPNLVLCFSDNASTDTTAELIEWAKTGPVPVISTRHDAMLSQAENWNAAVALAPAEAKYFRVWCVDDIQTPDAIEKLVDLMERNPEVGVAGSYCVNYGSMVDNRGLDPNREVFSGAEAARPFLLRKFDPIPASHVMVRTSLLSDEVPLYDASSGINFLDNEMVLRLLQHTQFGLVPEALGYVRVQAESVTQSVAKPQKKEIADWLTFIDRYGSAYFTDEEVANVRRWHLNHYRRQLFRWRFDKSVKPEVIAKHSDRLARDGYKTGLVQLLGAVLARIFRTERLPECDQWVDMNAEEQAHSDAERVAYLNSLLAAYDATQPQM